jgi:hypothetical protein
MSPFEVVQAIQSAGVGVVGLDLRRTVVILRSVDDQNAGETVVIRFWCISQRIEKCGRSHEGKVKRHLVTSATVTRVRIDDERAGFNLIFFHIFHIFSLFNNESAGSTG